MPEATPNSAAQPLQPVAAAVATPVVVFDDVSIAFDLKPVLTHLSLSVTSEKLASSLAQPAAENPFS
jgi:hypothetical protein